MPFTQTGDRELTATTPQDGVLAPPGYYYLFVNHVGGEGDKGSEGDGSYVTSVARIVHVGDESDCLAGPRSDR